MTDDVDYVDIATMVVEDHIPFATHALRIVGILLVLALCDHGILAPLVKARLAKPNNPNPNPNPNVASPLTRGLGLR